MCARVNNFEQALNPPHCVHSHFDIAEIIDVTKMWTLWNLCDNCQKCIENRVMPQLLFPPSQWGVWIQKMIWLQAVAASITQTRQKWQKWVENDRKWSKAACNGQKSRLIFLKLWLLFSICHPLCASAKALVHNIACCTAPLWHTHTWTCTIARFYGMNTTLCFCLGKSYFTSHEISFLINY